MRRPRPSNMGSYSRSLPGQSSVSPAGGCRRGAAEIINAKFLDEVVCAGKDISCVAAGELYTGMVRVSAWAAPQSLISTHRSSALQKPLATLKWRGNELP